MRRIPTDDGEIGALYSAGATPDSIALAFNLKVGTIRNRLYAMGLRRPILTLEQRFWAKVNKTSTCWLWTGATDGRGYGCFHFGARNEIEKAHRFSYFLSHGYFPAIEVCHHCDTPPCVRPEHLYAGTHLQNMRDAFARNRIDHKKKGEAWSARLRSDPELKAKVMANLRWAK